MSLPAPAAKPGAAPLCAHCGLPVPSSRRREEGPQFCCGGCEQVYGLIHQWGYGQFYRFAGQHGEPLEPAKVSGRDFGEMDDSRLVAELSDPMTQGRCRTRLYLEGVHCAARRGRPCRASGGRSTGSATPRTCTGPGGCRRPAGGRTAQHS